MTSTERPVGRPFDLVLFGATGFAGRLVAAYLARQAPSGLRVALAGRSIPKLEQVRAGLSLHAKNWGLLHADSSDLASLRALAQSTRAVVTTVGPFARHGVPLVQACVDAGTDYADITGEALFMHETCTRFHERARQTGSRIVHACGFDSVPSDIGTFVLHRHVASADLGDLCETRFAANIAGGLSGGTIDTIRTQLAAQRSDARARAILADPYSLSPNPGSEPKLGDQRDPAVVVKDKTTGRFMAPFLMGPTNARVVRRSNALFGHAYGRSFRYAEFQDTGSGISGALTAHGIHLGSSFLQRAMGWPPAAALIDRLLPSPGEGPSQASQDRGYLRIEITAQTSSGAQVCCFVRGDGDPGYKANAVMVGESALCLAMDEAQEPFRGGVLTPASALGDRLVARLRRAGHTYEAFTVSDKQTPG